MLKMIQEVSGAKTMDAVIPVSQKQFKEGMSEARLNDSMMMLQVAKLANKLDVELLDEDEVKDKAMEMTRVQGIDLAYQKEEMNYWTRKQKERSGSLFEKAQSAFIGSPVHPAKKEKYQEVVDINNIPDEVAEEEMEEGEEAPV